MTSMRQNEDVYESEDVSEVDRNVILREDPKNPQIELVHIDIDAAKKRFDGRILNFRGVDFSDSIAKQRLAAYGSSAYVLEIVGRDYPEAETPEQKFNRLTYEINELSDELAKTDYKTADPLLNVTSVNKLLEELKDVKANKSTGKATTNGVVARHRTQMVADPSLVALEQRLRRLESVVGQHDGTKQSLADTIEELKLRADSLNTVYVDGVETRLNKVLTQLDQVDERKDKVGIHSDIEAEVNELTALMKKWDASCTTLPANVKKVQALHRLHEQAQHFSERVALLAGLRDSVEKAVTADHETLRELQIRAKEDFNSMSKQISELHKRLNDLGM